MSSPVIQISSLMRCFGAAEQGNESAILGVDKRNQAQALCETVYVTLKEQSTEWKSRSLFERQWVVRDFKKIAGMPVEEWLSNLEQLEKTLRGDGAVTALPLDKLAGYYEHLAELAKGYEKDSAKLEDSLHHVYGWRDDVKSLMKFL